MPEDITVATRPKTARYGTMAGEPSEHFLDARLFRGLLARRLAPRHEKPGPLSFEFGTFNKSTSRGGARLGVKLERLAQVPGVLPGRPRIGFAGRRQPLWASASPTPCGKFLSQETGQGVAALGNGTGVSAQDTVPFALFCAGQRLGCFEEATRMIVGGPGDRDTAGAIVGGIVALFTGSRAIPADWLRSREPLPDWHLRSDG